ncbi:MAG: DnaJ family domain-containing protein [Anaerolineales bacterium]
MPDFSIEEIIRQAVQEGVFDDLPGKGKPLKIDHNPFQDPDWRVAHHLLKSSGFSLPWIELFGEIHANLQQARENIERAWAWQQSEQDRNSTDKTAQVAWKSSVNLFEHQVQAVNDQIRTYNLNVPNHQFQIPLVEADQELARLMNKQDS